MHSSAVALRSPAVISMSISRPGRMFDTSPARRMQLVGLLAHGADDDDDVVAAAPGAGDVVGHLPDALGVGDRRAAELLDDERHGGERYRRAGSPTYPVRADSEAQEARRYGLRPCPPRSDSDRTRAASAGSRPSGRPPSAASAPRAGATWPSSSCCSWAPPSLVSVLSGDDGDDDGHQRSTVTTAAGDTGTTTAAGRGAGPAIGESECPPEEGTAERVETFAAGPKACIDPAKTYTATVETTKGTFVVELDAAAAPEDRQQLRLPGPLPLLRRRRLPPDHPGLRRPVRRPARAAATRRARLRVRRRAARRARRRLRDRLAGHGQLRRRTPTAASSSSSPATRASTCRRATRVFGQVIEGLDVVQAIEATGSGGRHASEETDDRARSPSPRSRSTRQQTALPEGRAVEVADLVVDVDGDRPAPGRVQRPSG